MFRKEGNNIYWFLPSRVANFFANRSLKKRDKFLIEEQKKIKNKDITIVANNCLGGRIYHDYGIQFKSPFIKLYIEPDDFYKLIVNFDHYVDPKLKLKQIQSNGCSHPVGLLDDIKIFFIHYDSFDEAKDAWERRVKRINKEKVYFLMSDTPNYKDDAFDYSYISKEKLKKFLELGKRNFAFLTTDLNKKNMNNEHVIVLKKYLNKRNYYYGSIELFGKGKRCFERYLNPVELINSL